MSEIMEVPLPRAFCRDLINFLTFQISTFLSEVVSSDMLAADEGTATVLLPPPASQDFEAPGSFFGGFWKMIKRDGEDSFIKKRYGSMMKKRGGWVLLSLGISL